MKTLAPKKLNTQIYSEASEWFVEFRTGDIKASDRGAFARWLRTSPEHVRAYLELAAIWNEGGRLDPDRQFDDETLVQAALTEGNVLPLERRSTMESRSEVPGPAIAGIRALAIAAAVIIAAIGVGVWLSIQRGVYATGIGEQRSITLADGSHIELNTGSKLRIHFTDSERQVNLLDGQAYFRVAKDHARPFVVTSDNARVRAVGTQFDVYRKKNETTVTVLEGTVAVLPSAALLRSGSAPPDSGTANTTGSAAALTHRSEPSEVLEKIQREILLAAGEQAIVTAQATALPAKPDITAATAWTHKSLVFQSAPLSEVAEEFNRYNQRRLIIQSPQLYDFHITGIFSSTDPAALLHFLETRPGIIITERKDDILITRKP